MRLSTLSGLAVLLLISVVPAQAITLGQNETFESGAGGWSGSPSSLLVSNGGPNGAGDAYLQAGTPAFPTYLEVSQRTWGGDYVAAGVNAIEADFVNLGASALSIRFYFTTTSFYWSALPFSLPADGRWYHMRFGLGPEQITPDPILALREVGLIGFIHQVDLADTGGTPVIGSFGIDNIRAVPEPSPLTLLIGAGVAFFWRRPLRKQI